jgi:MoxR-like ATPase
MTESMTNSQNNLQERLTEAEVLQLKAPWDNLRQEVSKVFIGMPEVVERICICLLCGGHMLLEGVPGTAKTHLLNVIAKLLGLSFSRIQFTPDLMPSDLVGTLIYNAKEHTFTPKLGPVMANFLLTDEINRAPAKVQSALLEVMAEHQVTLGEKSYRVPQPFFVCASQNPVEQEGTFYLPEAQKDRFFFKINMGYLPFEQECELLKKIDYLNKGISHLKPVMTDKQIIEMQKKVERIFVDEKVMNYIVRLVQATRNTAEVLGTKWLDLGGSPRASIALYRGSRAKAFLSGRAYVIPQDVISIAKDVLEHRVIPSVESEVSDLKIPDVIEKIVAKVPQP